MRLQLRRKRGKARPRRIATSLALAACSLLGSEPGRSVAAEEPDRWSFDTAVLYFNEKERIQDLSASALIRRFFSRDRLLSMRVVYDTLTGASANGAVPAGQPQTFTSSSGGRGYTVQPGETPLDPTFSDERYALDLGWSQPVGLKSQMGLGFSVSNETDYLSTGVNARFSRDFNQHNTTLSGAVAYSYDTISPLGGVPRPFAAMGPPRGDDDEDEHDRATRPLGTGLNAVGGEAAGVLLPPAPGKIHSGGAEAKSVADLNLGVTQVFGPRTVALFSYSYSRSSGYLTDPYKLLSVVDPVSGEPVPDPNGLINVYVYESRPDTRTKHGLYTELRHHLGRDVVGGSYRFMTDDWGIRSHTVDLSYRWQPASRFYLQPHVRWYTQTAADFYERVLFSGDRAPAYASADYRLGALDAWTAGVKWGLPLDPPREWSLRVEYYTQSGTSPPEARVGALRRYDLFPDVSSLIFQVGFDF